MEGTDARTWETRFDWTLTALMFGAFGLAIFLSGLGARDRSNGLWAAMIAGSYVVFLQATPRSIRERRLVGEALATVGVIATLTAVALTAADNGGYVLMVAVPIFFASAFMGFRVGMETALLATAGLVAILIVLEEPVLERATTVVLYLLIGFTFSQARRLLVIERERSAALREAGAVDAARIERLEAAHQLLVSLTDVAGTSELSTTSVGESTLLDLAAAIPMVRGTVSIGTGEDDVAAEWGTPVDAPPTSEVPIVASGRTLGVLRIWLPPDENPEDYARTIAASTAGAALAFDNIRLLRTVARRSIQDERSRVARELHDDIGPALASLGLNMDILLTMENTSSTERQLTRLRAMVTELVERVRSSVAMLRRADTTTVVEHIHRIAAELGGGPPAIVVAIDERAQADGAVAAEVGAILIEAVRNAAKHADAHKIRIDGYVATEHGRISVEDDGRGFDASADYPGHFGLVGMRERAAAIGGSVDISSVVGRGTTLTVVWGDQSPAAP